MKKTLLKEMREDKDKLEKFYENRAMKSGAHVTTWTASDFRGYAYLSYSLQYQSVFDEFDEFLSELEKNLKNTKKIEEFFKKFYRNTAQYCLLYDDEDFLNRFESIFTDIDKKQDTNFEKWIKSEKKIISRNIINIHRIFTNHLNWLINNFKKSQKPTEVEVGNLLGNFRDYVFQMIGKPYKTTIENFTSTVMPIFSDIYIEIFKIGYKVPDIWNKVKKTFEEIDKSFEVSVFKNIERKVWKTKSKDFSIKTINLFRKPVKNQEIEIEFCDIKIYKGKTNSKGIFKIKLLPGTYTIKTKGLFNRRKTINLEESENMSFWLLKTKEKK